MYGVRQIGNVNITRATRYEKGIRFTEGERGKYARRFEKGTNLVLLEPEVARYFPTAKSVNRALKRLISEGKIDLPHKS